tara:strand:- start:39058 stop:41049 length:1992 start_codon:yes stop_codon:yes gene_type:complete
MGKKKNKIADIKAHLLRQRDKYTKLKENATHEADTNTANIKLGQVEEGLAELDAFQQDNNGNNGGQQQPQGMQPQHQMPDGSMMPGEQHGGQQGMPMGNPEMGQPQFTRNGGHLNMYYNGGYSGYNSYDNVLKQVEVDGGISGAFTPTMRGVSQFPTRDMSSPGQVTHQPRPISLESANLAQPNNTGSPMLSNQREAPMTSMTPQGTKQFNIPAPETGTIAPKEIETSQNSFGNGNGFDMGKAASIATVAAPIITGLMKKPEDSGYKNGMPGNNGYTKKNQYQLNNRPYKQGGSIPMYPDGGYLSPENNMTNFKIPEQQSSFNGSAPNRYSTIDQEEALRRETNALGSSYASAAIKADNDERLRMAQQNYSNNPKVQAPRVNRPDEIPADDNEEDREKQIVDEEIANSSQSKKIDDYNKQVANKGFWSTPGHTYNADSGSWGMPGIATDNPFKEEENTTSPNQRKNDYFSNAIQLAAPAYNMYSALQKPDKFPDIKNPYKGEILNSIKPNYESYNPQLAELRRQQGATNAAIPGMSGGSAQQALLATTATGLGYGDKMAQTIAATNARNNQIKTQAGLRKAQAMQQFYTQEASEKGQKRQFDLGSKAKQEDLMAQSLRDFGEFSQREDIDSGTVNANAMQMEILRKNYPDQYEEIMSKYQNLG